MDHNAEQVSPPGVLKRPRPVISCLECRRKKLKCDRILPCQQCVKTGRPSVCSYQQGQEPEINEDHPLEKRTRHSTADSVISVLDKPLPRKPLELEAHGAPLTNSPGIFEQLIQRVTKLEQLAGAVVDLDAASHSRSTPESLVYTTLKKVRLDRKTSARNAFPDAARFMQRLNGSSSESTLYRVKQGLRNVFTALRSHQLRQGTTSNKLSRSQLLRALPNRQDCEVLIELYFDNFEHCFRILHRPSFDQQFRRFCESDGNDEEGWFFPQLLGVLAVASILETRKECFAFSSTSGRQLGIPSAQYMQNYLNGLAPRQRHQITALQIRMLSLLLRWLQLEPVSDLWDYSGQILRQALLMKLDKDPSEFTASMDIIQAEIRRRLWTTIVEQDMMLSILCNMPCLVPEFTCQSPLNVNDNELNPEATTAPASRSVHEWTDSMCQYVLAQSVRQRLQACKDFYNPESRKYSQCLEHMRSFEKVLQDLPPPLRFNHRGDQASKGPARLMARMELDISIRRPLMYLYSPFAYANNEEGNTYDEAQVGFLQSCLMLTCYQDLFDPKFSELEVERPEGYWDFFYNVYRTELNQANLGICLEIKRLSNASVPHPPAPIKRTTSGLKVHQSTKSSLIGTMQDSLEPMTRHVSHYGANLKDLVYTTIVLNSVRGAEHDDKIVIEGVEHLIAVCKTQLERDGISVVVSTNALEMHDDSGSGNNGGGGGGLPDFSHYGDFDPSWMDFPNLGLDCCPQSQRYGEVTHETMA